ncbi:D-sedoheptulose 7-phosphate isomerase [Aquincola tertiaricarbonis]|uniref:D-sedoheptulose 7-phosphate isomerase n=1 Tax=Aquincola tertiaricarbonis TaxID=391953 RepID=UPI000614A5D2|nr:D-sedoheptulose 7-phosphate isomerase [Aquincola tertiaricarbonis]
MSSLFLDNVEQHLDVMRRLPALEADVERVGALLAAVLQAGNKLLVCGNGGSAADAQHLASELTGRFIKDRRPLAAIALSTDSSALTCIGNDYGFDDVFARQVQALARPGDCFIGISTSGRSPNVLKAAAAAREAGAKVVGLLGRDGGPLLAKSDLAIVAPSDVTARIQEVHILVIHTLCGLIEDKLGIA